jgi:hypothetical protein
MMRLLLSAVPLFVPPNAIGRIPVVTAPMFRFVICEPFAAGSLFEPSRTTTLFGVLMSASPLR